MAMLGHAFAKPEVAEVVATADLNNPASIRVPEKSGMTFHSRAESQVTYLVASRG